MSLNQQPPPPLFFQGPLTSSIPAKEHKYAFKYVCYKALHKTHTNYSSQYENIGFMKLRRTKVKIEIFSEELYAFVQVNQLSGERHLTMIALTMSLLLFLRARTAFARDTLACDMTSSMSLTSTPVSSTWRHKTELLH